jgi:hypothetical protein
MPVLCERKLATSQFPYTYSGLIVPVVCLVYNVFGAI